MMTVYLSICFVHFQGYTIPIGWSVVFGIRETHKRDETVHDSSSFNPDRWLNSDIPNKYTFLPFGGGQRVCPGQAYAKMVLKLFTIEFARQCTPTITTDSDISYWPVPRPSDTVVVSMKRA